MWKKHKKELFICGITCIIIVLLLLLIVTIFEKFNIHVPGSREMWIGLIGSILGGAFTLFGVLITIYKQEEQTIEANRLEYLPLLNFKVIESDTLENNSKFDGTLTCYKEELCTSAFQFIEQKLCETIVISVLNNECVFDFIMEGCLINGKEIVKGNAFNPASTRLVAGEEYRLLFDFDYSNYSNVNAFCLLRFSYKDIFGNGYYQDLPFVYIERKYNELVKQCIEIRDIKAPLLINPNTKSLEEVVTEYCDYDTLCL